MDIETATLVAEAQQARKQQYEETRRAARRAAGRNLGFALNYLIRNATKGDGERHGAMDQFADALTHFINTEREYA